MWSGKERVGWSVAGTRGMALRDDEVQLKVLEWREKRGKREYKR